MVAKDNRTLQQLISELNPDKVVRISTKNGSNFIYIGSVRDLDFARLELDVVNWHKRTIITAVNSGRPKSTLMKRINDYFDRKKLIDRIVLDLSPGILEPDHLRVRIEGCEGWLDYNPDIPPLETLHPEGAINLTEAIYKEAVDNLIAARRTASRGRDKKTRTIAKAEMESIKDFFRNDPFGYVTDAETVIERCQQIALGRTDRRF